MRPRMITTMDIKELLQQVAEGLMPVEEALAQMSRRPEIDLGFARVDLDRVERCGVPEIIFAAGKTPDQVTRIAEALREKGQPVLATRAEPAVFDHVQKTFPGARYHETARAIVIREDEPELTGRIAIVSAGTSDLPVAEESAVTCEFLGGRVDQITDVGVAGLHRLLKRVDRIREARVVIAVAGMEGALPSVLGGLIDRPLIALPTSVGYGMNLNGLAALLAMLNSCAPGITIVNVDNGFGAGVAAAMINRVPEKEK